LAAAFGLPVLSKQAYAVIWTTTPWTIPANQAINVHPEFDYALVETSRGLLVLANDLVASCLTRYALEGNVIATCKGAALAGGRFMTGAHRCCVQNMLRLTQAPASFLTAYGVMTLFLVQKRFTVDILNPSTNG
jgi:hypothetical protein